jgi:drug/metabolite transporter (DMT)-like permease
VITGIVLLTADTLALVWMLRRLPLTSVIPVTALVYVLVPIGAHVFFREKLRPRFWFGVLLIVAGVTIIAV